MPTIKLSNQYLLNELNLPFSAIKNTIIGNSRWSIHHEIVFIYNGKFYMTGYSVGATESQDESPWQYEDEVDCTEVHIVEKVVKDWEPVKD